MGLATGFGNEVTEKTWAEVWERRDMNRGITILTALKSKPIHALLDRDQLRYLAMPTI